MKGFKRSIIFVAKTYRHNKVRKYSQKKKRYSGSVTVDNVHEAFRVDVPNHRAI